MSENIKHLCRALAKHQDDLHKVIYNAAKLAESEAAENTQNFLIMQTPVIQGTSVQMNLTRIGNQEIDPQKVILGIQEMLESPIMPENKPETLLLQCPGCNAISSTNLLTREDIKRGICCSMCLGSKGEEHKLSIKEF